MGVDQLLDQYERGLIGRRQLLRGISLLGAAGAGSLVLPEALSAQAQPGAPAHTAMGPKSIMHGWPPYPSVRVKAETVNRFKKIPTQDLWSVCDRLGLNSFTHVVRPVAPGMKICGTAVTMRLVPIQNKKDYWKVGSQDFEHSVHTLSRLSRPGDIHVVDMGGFIDASLFGGNAAQDAKYFGVAGIIIDGASRDTNQIVAQGFSCFARTAVAPHAHGMFRTANLNNEPVTVGSISISPGDVVVGDADGIVVVPASRAEEIIPLAERVVERESVSVTAWERGEDSPGGHHAQSLDQLDPSLILNIPKGVVDPRKK